MVLISLRSKCLEDERKNKKIYEEKWTILQLFLLFFKDDSERQKMKLIWYDVLFYRSFTKIKPDYGERYTYPAWYPRYKNFNIGRWNWINILN